MKKIKILTEKGKSMAEFVDKNPMTKKKIMDALPFQGRINRWGEEIYFEIPVKIGRERAQKEVEIGDIAYWPEGRAICIFLGKTPISKDKPVAYSPVNVFARVIGDFEVLKEMRNGDTIEFSLFSASFHLPINELS